MLTANMRRGKAPVPAGVGSPPPPSLFATGLTGSPPPPGVVSPLLKRPALDAPKRPSPPIRRNSAPRTAALTPPPWRGPRYWPRPRYRSRASNADTYLDRGASGAGDPAAGVYSG